MASRGRSARYMYIYDVETGYTGETRERAEQEWKPQKENGDNCARGNARGSSPYSGLKPATASAKLLTLWCAHMTRSAARDAHPAPLMPRAPPLRLPLILVWIRLLRTYMYISISVCVCIFVLNDGQDSLPGNLTHSTTLVAHVYRSAFFSLSIFDGFRYFEEKIWETKNKRSCAPSPSL